MAASLSRRHLLGLAAGVAGSALLAACSTDDDNTPATPAATDAVAAQATPTSPPLATATATLMPTSTPTIVVPTATATTVPPTPTATAMPPTAEPTATPEAIRFNGTLPFEVVSITPEWLPFDWMVPNPEYPDAEAAIQYLGLRSLAQIQYAMENPVIRHPDLNIVNNPDTDGLKQRMLSGNVEFLVPGHAPENMNISSAIQMVNVRPDQGVRFEIAVAPDQHSNRDFASGVVNWDGNIEPITNLQYRIGVTETNRLILRMVYGANRDGSLSYDQTNAMYVLDDLAYGIGLFRFRHHLTNSGRGVVPPDQDDLEIRSILFKHLPDREVNNKYIFDYWDRPSAPLLIFNR